MITAFLFEIYRLAQWVSPYPNCIYVISNNLEGVIPLNMSGNEEVYHSYQLFSKALKNKGVFLNKHQGKLRVNWIKFRIETKVDEIIPESEWSHLDIDC